MALAFHNLSTGFLLLALSFGLEAATIFRLDEECPCIDVAGCASMLGLTSKDGLIRSFPVCEYEELVRCCDDLTGLRKLRSSGRFSPPDPYLHGDRIPDEMKSSSVSGSERRGRLLELPPGIVEPTRVVYPEYIDPRTNLGSSSMTSNRGITGRHLVQPNVNPRSKLHDNFGPTRNDFLGRYDQSSFTPAPITRVENSFGGNSELRNSVPASMGMNNVHGQRHYIHISRKPEDGFQRYGIRPNKNARDELQGHFDEADFVPTVENRENGFGGGYGTREPLHIELPFPIAHLSWLRHSPRVENGGGNALPNNVGMLNYVQGNREDSKLRGNVRQTIPFVYPEYFDYRSVNRDRAQSVEPFTVSGQSNRVTPTPNIFLTPAKQEEPSKQTLELGWPNPTGETDHGKEKKIGKMEVSGKVEASAEDNPHITKIFLIEDLPPAPSIPVSFGSFSREKVPSRNLGKFSESTNPEDGSSGSGQKQNKSMGNFQTREPISRENSHPHAENSHQAENKRVPHIVHKPEEEHELNAHDGKMMNVEVAEALDLLNNSEGKFGARLAEHVPHAEQKEAVESVKKQEHDGVLREVENVGVKQPLMSSDDVSPKIDAATIDRAKSVQVNNKISNSRLSALYGEGGRHHPSRKLVSPANRRFVQRTTMARVNATQRTKTVGKPDEELSTRRQFFGRQRPRSVINATSSNDESHSDQMIPREKPRPERRESFQHFIRQRQGQTATNASMEKTVRDDEKNEATTPEADELDDSIGNVEETEGMQEADEHRDLKRKTETEDDGQNDRAIESLHGEEIQSQDEDQNENQSSKPNEPSFRSKDELKIEMEAKSRHHDESDVQKQKKHEVNEFDRGQNQAVEEEQLQGQDVEEQQGQGQIVEETLGWGQGQVVEEGQRQGQRQVIEEEQGQSRVVEEEQGQGQGRVVEEEQRQGQDVEEGQGQAQGRVVEEEQSQGRVVEEEQSQGQGRVVEEKQRQGQDVEEGQGQAQGRVVEEQCQGQVVEEGQGQGRAIEEEQGQGRGQVVEEDQGRGQGQVVEEEQRQDQVANEEQGQGQGQGQVVGEESHQGQVVEEGQVQGRVIEEEEGQGRGQVVEEERGQSRGQFVEEDQGQSRVVDEEQRQGQVLDEEQGQGQGQVVEEEQRQGQVVEEEGQGQAVMEQAEEVRHSKENEDRVRKNNEDAQPNLNENTIEEQQQIEDEKMDENEKENQGGTEILGQNGGQVRIEGGENVEDCGGNENQEHCRKRFEVGVPNPVQDDLETKEQMEIRHKHEDTEQIREQGLSEREERNEDGNERTAEGVVDDGKLIEMEQRDRNRGENREETETIFKDSELKSATTTGVYPDNVTLEIDNLSTERSETVNREYSGGRSNNLDNYRKGVNEDVLSIGLERNENPKPNETTMISEETGVRDAKTANNGETNVELSKSADFRVLSEQGVGLDRQNGGVHTTEAPKMVTRRRQMMRRRYGKRRRVVDRKKFVTNETMESNVTRIEAKQTSGDTESQKMEFEAKLTRNEREQTENEEKQKNIEPSRTDESNGSGSVRKQSSIAYLRKEMNNETGRKYDERSDSKQTNVRDTNNEARQKNVVAGKEETEATKDDDARQKGNDNGQFSNEGAEQMNFEKEKRRKPLLEMAEMLLSDFEVLSSRDDARERESRRANSFALERQSGVESVTISPDELALPGRITVIGPIPKGFRDPAIISHEEEFGLELPTSNAEIFRQSGSAS